MEKTIDLSKLPVVEGKNIVNIVALNGLGELIKAENDYLTSDALDGYVTEEELGVALENAVVEESDPVFNEWKNTSTNIAIGSGSTANTNGIAIGTQVHSLGGIVIGSAKSGVNLTPGVNQVFIGRELENCHTSDAVAIGKSCPNTLFYDKLDGTLHTVENCSVNLNGKLYADWFGNIYIQYENSVGNTKRIKLQDYLQRQWFGTQAEYDALGTYDNNTIYNILNEE